MGKDRSHVRTFAVQRVGQRVARVSYEEVGRVVEEPVDLPHLVHEIAG